MEEKKVTVETFHWEDYTIKATYNGDFDVKRLAKSIIDTVDEFELKKKLERKSS